MKRTLIKLAMAGIAGMAGAAAVGGVAWILWSGQTSAQVARAERDAARAEAQSVQAQWMAQAQAARQSEERWRTRVDELESELAAQRARGSGTNAATRAVRAWVFLSGEQVGEAWVVPSAERDPAKAGQARASVLLDTAVKARLRAPLADNAAASRTVLLERQQETVWSPVWWPGLGYGNAVDCTNTPGRPAHQPANPPGTAATANPGGIWRPTAKPFQPVNTGWPIVSPMRSGPAGVPMNPGVGTAGVVGPATVRPALSMPRRAVR